MGIDIKVDYIESQKPEIHYPCLMISRITGNILLMTSYSNGTVLVCAGDKPSIGYHYESFNLDSLELFNGTITLSNNKE